MRHITLFLSKPSFIAFGAIENKEVIGLHRRLVQSVLDFLGCFGTKRLNKNHQQDHSIFLSQKSVNYSVQTRMESILIDVICSQLNAKN